VKAQVSMTRVRAKSRGAEVAAPLEIAAPATLYEADFSKRRQKTRNRSFSRPSGRRLRCGCYDRRGRSANESQSTGPHHTKFLTLPKNTMFRPKVTPGDDGMLTVQFIDGGQDAHLRVLLRWEKSVMPSHEPFIASGGVVGEEEIVLSQPTRFAPISEIIGSPIICHARFQSR
jgi:hypothetical protein